MNKRTRLIGFAAFVFTSAWFAVGCVSSPEAQANRSRERALMALKPYRTIPAQRPAWIDNIQHSKAELAFVGVSDKFATEAEARNKAQANGRDQLVKYFGTQISDQSRTAKSTYGISSDIFTPQQASQELQEAVSKGLSQKLAAHSFYIEAYLTKDEEEYYVAYVMMKIDKSDVNKMLEKYCDDKANETRKKAAAEKDVERKKQLEKVADFFGGDLKSSLTE